MWVHSNDTEQTGDEILPGPRLHWIDCQKNSRNHEIHKPIPGYEIIGHNDRIFSVFEIYIFEFGFNQDGKAAKTFLQLNLHTRMRSEGLFWKSRSRRGKTSYEVVLSTINCIARRRKDNVPAQIIPTIFFASIYFRISNCTEGCFDIVSAPFAPPGIMRASYVS